MELPHMPRRNFVHIEDFDFLMPTGYSSTGKPLSLASIQGIEGLESLRLMNCTGSPPATSAYGLRRYDALSVNP